MPLPRFTLKSFSYKNGVLDYQINVVGGSELVGQRAGEKNVCLNYVEKLIARRNNFAPHGIAKQLKTPISEKGVVK